MDEPSKRILVAMSGGVDSSVAAAQLIRQGHEVIGATLRLQAREEDPATKDLCGGDQVTHARAVADKLGFTHHVIDGRGEFEKKVLRPAWDEYARGRTPNPCVICNHRLKFGLLMDKAKALGADKVSTGHYARISMQADGSSPMLLRGIDADKDQSYFLFSLTSEQLSKIVFPLGEFTKKEVRELARELGFPNADKPESQDACLVAGDGGFAEALRQRFSEEPRPGNIVSSTGEVLCRHEGIHRFTIGQRRGLGVALGKPAYVQTICEDTGDVVIGSDEQMLLAAGMRVAQICWKIESSPDTAIDADVQIRYNHRAVSARITLRGEGKADVVFSTPQRAVTPGQAAVFYKGDLLIGGGWIEGVIN